MRNHLFAAVFGTALLAALGIAHPANAVTVHTYYRPNTLSLDQREYYWRGKPYCWYQQAWNGPGWYRCGARDNVGYGFGGRYGWHGWRDRDFHQRDERDFHDRLHGDFDWAGPY